MSEPETPAAAPDPGPMPEGGLQPLKLEANLDLTMATELAKSILALRGSTLTIDASRVQHIGGQCGQVLVSALNTWKADDVAFRIVDGSTEFVEGLRLLGLRSALETEDAHS